MISNRTIKRQCLGQRGDGMRTSVGQGSRRSTGSLTRTMWPAESPQEWTSREGWTFNKLC